MFKKILIVLALLLLLPSAVFAATSSTLFSVSPEALVVGAGSIESSAYKSLSVAGDSVNGAPTSTLYSTAIGSNASDVFAAAADSIAPTITTLKFDGRTIINGDYVNANVSITATVTDDSTGIDTSRSSIEADGVFITYASLSGDSSFTAATGALIYKPTFPAGTHTVRVHAMDVSGNGARTAAFTFKVTSDTQIIGEVLNYKNPFNPAAGESTSIEYMLTADADITIYIFNLINQSVKKISCSKAAEGGHAGYNQVTWDGYTDFGDIAANDVYIARVVTGGRQIGKCKIIVLK